MNKKNNRKGFTIVELVIVIAVIAILATVLVPTFSGIVSDSKKTAAIQEAKNIYTQYVAETAKTGDINDNVTVKIGSGSDVKYVKIDNGTVDDKTCEAPAVDGKCTAVLSMVSGEPKINYVGTVHAWGGSDAAGTKCPVGCGTAKP